MPVVRVGGAARFTFLWLSYATRNVSRPRVMVASPRILSASSDFFSVVAPMWFVT